MLPQLGKTGVKAHAVHKNEKVPEQNSQRMAHEEVLKAGAFGCSDILLDGHEGIGTDMRTPEFGIVMVVVVVGASPNTARAEHQDAENPHNAFGQPGTRQNRLVLLIMVDDKEPKIQQPSEATADHPTNKMEIP
jgi:hypothetical protein